MYPWTKDYDMFFEGIHWKMDEIEQDIFNLLNEESDEDDTKEMRNEKKNKSTRDESTKPKSDESTKPKRDESMGPTRDEIEKFVQEYFDIQGTFEAFMEEHGDYIKQLMGSNDFKDLANFSEKLYQLDRGYHSDHYFN